VNAGAIDFGNTGEAPPIFAQAAGDAIVYVAHEPPAPRGEAILVPKNSPIKTLAGLRTGHPRLVVSGYPTAGGLLRRL